MSVSGWAGYIGPFHDAFWHSPGPKDSAYPSSITEKDSKDIHRFGKIFFADGRTFYGTWRDDLMCDGILTTLEDGNVRKTWKVRYDQECDYECCRGSHE